MKAIEAICVSLTLLLLMHAQQGQATAAKPDAGKPDTAKSDTASKPTVAKSPRALKFSELTPNVIQDRLHAYLSSPANKLRDKAAGLIDLNKVQVEADGFSKDPKNASVRISYQLLPGKADSPAVKDLVNLMIQNFFKETLERERPRPVPKAKKPEMMAKIAAPIAAPIPVRSRPAPLPIQPPAPTRVNGLSLPAVELVAGYVNAEGPVSLSAEDSFDVAYACYIRGLYEDAVVLANRGLAKRKDARLLLVKGVCQLHLGQGTEAQHTATAYQSAIALGQTGGLAMAQERINDSMSSRFGSFGGSKNRL